MATSCVSKEQAGSSIPWIATDLADWWRKSEKAREQTRVVFWFERLSGATPAGTTGVVSRVYGVPCPKGVSGDWETFKTALLESCPEKDAEAQKSWQIEKISIEPTLFDGQLQNLLDKACFNFPLLKQEGITEPYFDPTVSFLFSFEKVLCLEARLSPTKEGHDNDKALTLAWLTPNENTVYEKNVPRVFVDMLIRHAREAWCACVFQRKTPFHQNGDLYWGDGAVAVRRRIRISPSNVWKHIWTSGEAGFTSNRFALPNESCLVFGHTENYAHIPTRGRAWLRKKTQQCAENERTVFGRWARDMLQKIRVPAKDGASIPWMTDPAYAKYFQAEIYRTRHPWLMEKKECLSIEELFAKLHGALLEATMEGWKNAEDGEAGDTQWADIGPHIRAAISARRVSMEAPSQSGETHDMFMLWEILPWVVSDFRQAYEEAVKTTIDLNAARERERGLLERMAASKEFPLFVEKAMPGMFGRIEDLLSIAAENAAIAWLDFLTQRIPLEHMPTPWSIPRKESDTRDAGEKTEENHEVLPENVSLSTVPAGAAKEDSSEKAIPGKLTRLGQYIKKSLPNPHRRKASRKENEGEKSRSVLFLESNGETSKDGRYTEKLVQPSVDLPPASRWDNHMRYSWSLLGLKENREPRQGLAIVAHMARAGVSTEMLANTRRFLHDLQQIATILITLIPRSDEEAQRDLATHTDSSYVLSRELNFQKIIDPVAKVAAAGKDTLAEKVEVCLSVSEEQLVKYQAMLNILKNLRTQLISLRGQWENEVSSGSACDASSDCRIDARTRCLFDECQAHIDIFEQRVGSHVQLLQFLIHRLGTLSWTKTFAIGARDFVAKKLAKKQESSSAADVIARETPTNASRFGENFFDNELLNEEFDRWPPRRPPSRPPSAQLWLHLARLRNYD